MTAPGDQSRHGIQFYETEPFLHRAVTSFFGERVDAGDTLVMIARPVTRDAVAGHLAPHRIQFFDAEETLSRIMDGNTLQPTLCEQLFAAVLSDASAKSNHGRIRLYGEMVDLLCARGNHAAAIDLEMLWNDKFAGRSGLSVLCTYGIERFDAGPHAATLLQLCRQHTHVMPVEAFAEVAEDGRLERAVVLQHRARTSKVYVVDDDASVRRSLARLLHSHGFRVQTFESAEAFLEEVDASADGYLILDLQLLGMSGPDLQGRLSATRWLLPVIAMSGSHDSQLEDEALRLGARAFLPKPFEAHALLNAIARVEL